MYNIAKNILNICYNNNFFQFQSQV